MSVVSMVVGAPTDSGARVVTKVSSSANVRLAVADNPGMEGPVFFGPITPNAQNVASVTASGLNPDTRYWWRIEHGGVIDTTFIAGRFRTDPPLGEPASFEVVVAGDAGLTPVYPGVGAVLAANRMSNHPVFDVIRARDPRFFIHPGDAHYYDDYLQHGITGGATLANIRRSYDDLLLQPRQHQLYREVPWIYPCYGDHDSALGNDRRGTEDPTAAANALQVYQERVPHFPLVAGAGTFQPWEVGRILFVGLDGRTFGDDNEAPQSPSKTMLGATQKSALESALLSSDAKFLVLVVESQWTATTHPDSWASFTNERAELVQMFGDTGWLDRMMVTYPDRHAAGIDAGRNTDGGFPILLAASLDATPSDLKVDFDLGASVPGRGQYGTIAVDDHGPVIRVKIGTWRMNQQLLTHSFAISTGEPTFSEAITRAVSGSHQATFEARVIEDFQVGAAPEGKTIPILSGDVQLDGTAEVRGTLDMSTDGNGAFPRGGEGLLAPFGSEIFVRRGVDLGDRVEWAPLGYYRIDSVEQRDAPNGPISVGGSDRMAGIVDGRLPTPVQLTADRLIGHIFYELVTDIYPDAVILFDDDLHKTKLGRSLVVEESRHEVLADIATAHGKIMYWDGIGVLRVEDAPEATEIAWEVKAGEGGVLIEASRRLSREGVYNGVVAYGEAADTEQPARALVVDRNPNSATVWGGRFGKVVRFYSSPVIVNQGQADSAATSMLRRSIGFPYSVDLTAVPHPGIKPYDPVLVRQSSGDRDVHVIQSVTIPLTVDAALSATTREQTLIVLGGAR